jgi:hypothetical protein
MVSVHHNDLTLVTASFRTPLVGPRLRLWLRLRLRADIRLPCDLIGSTTHNGPARGIKRKGNFLSKSGQRKDRESEDANKFFHGAGSDTEELRLERRQE